MGKFFTGVFRRFWIPVVLAACIGLVIGGVSAAMKPKQYTSTASLIVNPGAPAKGVDVAGLNTFIASRMQTYDALASSAMVLNPVISSLGLKDQVTDVQSKLSFAIPTGSTIINVSATSGDSASAVKLSNAVARSLGSAIEKTTPAQATGAASVTVTNIQDGKDAVSPGGQSPLLTALLGGVVGGLVALGLCALLLMYQERTALFGRRADHPVRA